MRSTFVLTEVSLTTYEKISYQLSLFSRGDIKGTVLANGCTFQHPSVVLDIVFLSRKQSQSTQFHQRPARVPSSAEKEKQHFIYPLNFSQRDQFVSISKSGSKVNLLPPRIRMFVNTRMAVSQIKTISYRFVHPTPRRRQRLVPVAVCPSKALVVLDFYSMRIKACGQTNDTFRGFSVNSVVFFLLCTTLKHSYTAKENKYLLFSRI